MSDPQVRAQPAQLRRHQRQVVVLDQDGRARRRLPGQRLGEHRVVDLVRLPVALEGRAEGGLGRRRVEQVQDEPQRTVGDRVVRPVEDDPVHVEHVDGRAAGVMAGKIQTAVRRRPGGPPVRLADRRAHPDQPTTGPVAPTGRAGPVSPAGRAGPVSLVRPAEPTGRPGVIAGDRVQAADQPTAATAHDERPVVTRRERHRAAIGRDKHPGGPSSGHGTRRFIDRPGMTHPAKGSASAAAAPQSSPAPAHSTPGTHDTGALGTPDAVVRNGAQPAPARRISRLCA